MQWLAAARLSQRDADRRPRGATAERRCAASRRRSSPSCPACRCAGPTAAHCREAGEGLAWLHLAGAGFPAARANDLGHAAWAGLFAPLRGAAEALKPGLAATIAGDLDQLAAAWPRRPAAGRRSTPTSSPTTCSSATARSPAAIDFYFAADDLLAYDIGVGPERLVLRAGRQLQRHQRARLRRRLRAPPAAVSRPSAPPCRSWPAARPCASS